MSLNLPKNSDSAAQQEILDALPVLIFLERAGKIVFANAAARQMMGFATGDWTPRPIEEVLWGLFSGTAEPRTQLNGTEHGLPFHATMPHKSGKLMPVEGAYCQLDAESRESIIVAHSTGRERAPKPRLMEDVLSSLPEAVVIVHGNHVLYTNPAFSRMFGYTAEEMAGSDPKTLIVPETRQLENATIERIVDEQGQAAIETVRIAKNGDLLDVALLATPLMVNAGKVGYVFTYRDIAERKRVESKLQHDAMHDVLTGLPNRALFIDRLNLALARRLRRRDQSCGVLFLDLDRFKEINDTLGHAAGDALLKTIADRLRAAIRPQDTAARMGGDEFAVLVDCIGSIADLEIVASRILQEMKRPFDLFGHASDAGVSIGAAMAGADHLAPELLLRDADYAMYRAKQAGGSRFEVFDKRLEVHVSHQQERERELRQVLDKRLYEIWFQPILRLANGKIEGFESLLRWQRPDGPVDSFMSLMPVAEETGLSVSIGRDTIEAVCKRLRLWTGANSQADLSLTVNVSKRQFYHADWVPQLKRTLAATGADPTRLLFEMPEAVLADNPEGAAAILQRMVECNVRIAVDGFGAKLGPLNQMITLPVDVIKLDHAFTAAAAAGGRQAAVVQSLVHLGRTLGVQIVAQGIETHEQLEALERMGCELGQGRLFSDAVDLAQAERLVEQNRLITASAL